VPLSLLGGSAHGLPLGPMGRRDVGSTNFCENCYVCVLESLFVLGENSVVSFDVKPLGNFDLELIEAERVRSDHTGGI
jgi:hypothetical protein